jgi:hypothetical protein
VPDSSWRDHFEAESVSRVEHLVVVRDDLTQVRAEPSLAVCTGCDTRRRSAPLKRSGGEAFPVLCAV